MRNGLVLAGLAVAASVAVLQMPGAAAGPRNIPVRAFLCDTAEHAIQFADVMASGESEEIAKDRVGRTASAEVCGRYAGSASLESERVTLKRGTAYKVTAYRFKEDQRIAWLAERTFAPVSTNWDL